MTDAPPFTRRDCVPRCFHRLLQPTQLMHIAIRLWTSAHTLGGREFCSILNQVLRDDDRERVVHASAVTHAVRAVRIEASTPDPALSACG